MPFGPGGGGGGGGAAGGGSLVLDPPVAATITINGLASGAARQSAYVENTNNRPYAKVTLEIQTSAVAPTNGTIVEVWLLRTKAQVAAGLVGDDNTTDADQAYPAPPGLPRNATFIGAISVTADADTFFRGTFDVNDVVLGDFFGFAVSNRTDQALNAAGNVLTFELY